LLSPRIHEIALRTAKSSLTIHKQTSEVSEILQKLQNYLCKQIPEIFSEMH